MYIWNEQARKALLRHLQSKCHKCGRSLGKLALRVRMEPGSTADFKPFCLRQYDFMTDNEAKLFNIKQ